MSKRKVSFGENEYFSRKKRTIEPRGKKHTLDSDEEDDEDESQERLDADDIEGEEDGRPRQDEGVRMTAFNMKEELEEGHFDKDGHFIWKNEKEVRDNWLDNIDWHTVSGEDAARPERGLAESDSEGEPDEAFDELALYRRMLELMRPQESVSKAIRRLGAEVMKLSSVERLRRKKAGTLNTNEGVTHLTEFANTILTKTGNMNVYQETFEEITGRIDKKSGGEPALDMYADEFDAKSGPADGEGAPALRWEFKWEQHKEEVQGPFDTKQMIKWANEGHFKTGVWVRKCGEDSNFYTSNRIDFELYE